MLKKLIFRLFATWQFARLLLLAPSATHCAKVSHAQEQPKALYMPAPAYPERARRMNLTGTVKLKATITPDGLVKQVQILGGSPLLTDAAVDR